MRIRHNSSCNDQSGVGRTPAIPEIVPVSMRNGHTESGSATSLDKMFLQPVIQLQRICPTACPNDQSIAPSDLDETGSLTSSSVTSILSDSFHELQQSPSSLGLGQPTLLLPRINIAYYQQGESSGPSLSTDPTSPSSTTSVLGFSGASTYNNTPSPSESGGSRDAVRGVSVMIPRISSDLAHHLMMENLRGPVENFD